MLTIRDPARAEADAGRLLDSAASARRTAVISLEDIRWQLVIKGDVEGGACCFFTLFRATKQLLFAELPALTT